MIEDGLRTWDRVLDSPAGQLGAMRAAAALIAGSLPAATVHFITKLTGGRPTPAETATIFALALLASGLASSSVGTYVGQAIMEGFLRRRVPLAARRLITMLPAFTILAADVNPTRALILSQVTLSFGLTFALIPLIALASRRKLMDDLVNRRCTTPTAITVTVLIIALNGTLVWQALAG